MKTFKLKLVSVALSALMLFTGCYGSFGLVQKVHEFNGNVTDSKFVHEILFLVMVIVPVYSIASFIDVAILNLIEFWSGSNPLVMEEGEMEEKLVQLDGKEFKITATKNQFQIEEIDGESVVLRYHEDDTAWYLHNDEQEVKIGQLMSKKGNKKVVRQFFPDGHTEDVTL